MRPEEPREAPPERDWRDQDDLTVGEEERIQREREEQERREEEERERRANS